MRFVVPALVLWLSICVSMSPICINAAPATITNTSGSYNTARGFIPAYYGSKATDCRAPYHFFENGTMQSYTWDVVVMENDYIRIEVLPKLGGRVLKFINKATGSNQFYDNPAGFKQNGWGRLGWSCTGGTEVMLPLDEHHGPFYIPWDDGPSRYSKPWYIESHEGTILDGVRLTMVMDEDTAELYGGSNNRFRLQCVITLKDNEAAYTQALTLTNENASAQWAEVWSNSMVCPGPGNMRINDLSTLNMHTVYPKAVTQVYDHNNNGGPGWGPGGTTPFETLNWPYHNGRNISLLLTFYDPTDTFGYMGVFVANGVDVTFGGIYNLTADEGIVKTFPAQIAPGVDTGLKFWHWGASGITSFGEGTTTVMEIMSGPCTVFQEPGNCTFGTHPTGQPYRVSLPGTSSLSWTDTYISPRAIEDVVYATSKVVMNFDAPSSGQDGSSLPLTIGVYPVRPQAANARIAVDIGGVEIFTRTGTVGPHTSPAPFYQTPSPVLSGVPTGSQTIRLTIYYDDGSSDSYSQPITISPNPFATSTPTRTPTRTSTPTNTLPPTQTLTPTNTPTATVPVPTNTPGGTTPTPTNTPTSTPTNTPTVTPTNTTPAGFPIVEPFEVMPGWTSSDDAGWGNPGTWSIVSGGQTANYLRTSNTAEGSSVRVMVYNTLPTFTDVEISIWLRCPAQGSDYWMEFAYRFGSHSAFDFDTSPENWTLVQKFTNTGPNGNGNTWTRYSTLVNTGSDNTISVGFKLGSAPDAPPTVGWDTMRIDYAPVPPTSTFTPAPPTATPTPTRTNTPVPPTATYTNTPIPPTATFTPTATRTNTPVPPTATYTNTPIPPTATFTPTATRTNTPVPPTATFTPTATRTSTPIPPTATFTNTPIPPTATFTPTATRTNTPVPPTATYTNTPIPPTPTATWTNAPIYTPTPTRTYIAMTPTPTLSPTPWTPTPTALMSSVHDWEEYR